MVAWLRRNERTLGVKVDADVHEDDNGWPLALTSGLENVVVIGGSIEVPRLAPFERLAIPTALSGEHGSNRAREFAFIRAQHDLAAIHAYLNRYRDRPPTLRVYTKEIERLVLWLVVVRGVALSSMTVEDCEAYKDFLKGPVASFVGPKRSRASGRWRPFTPEGLSADSQAYAVRAIRAAFAWLTTVRYLAGNPWSAVSDPATITEEESVQVERALSADLWTAVRHALDQRCGDQLLNETPEQVRQWRTARAAILLMGDSGVRREEAAHARREDLRPVRHVAPIKSGKKAGEGGGAEVEIWALSVLGKRRRQRTVPVSAATLRALRAHWADRGENFDAAHNDAPLIAPLVIPATLTARVKHGREDGRRGEDSMQSQTNDHNRAQAKQGYAPDALARLVRQGIRQLAGELLREGVLSHDAHAQLLETSAHAFRHTFGTRAVARDMPIDVVQRVLGHASLQTTSIYVRAERRRMLDAAAQYYSEDGG
jgi:integrase